MSRTYETRYADSTSISSGFFNAVNHDRTYDAEQMGSMFDGLITDGVFSTIGSAFAVTAGTGMNINIAPGKAWFNKTWINSDSIATIEIAEAPYIMSRIDAVVIEVNKSETEMIGGADRGRKCHLAVVTGLAADEPVKPTLIHDGFIEQYALAYITVASQVTSITNAEIENVIGTEETPFVTGLLEHIDISELLQTFEAQAATQREGMATEFEDWFSHLQDELDAEQAAHLQNQINGIWTYLNNIGDAEQEEY